MTRMQEQKTELYSQALKAIKQLRHLTGNAAEVAAAQAALEQAKAAL